MRICVINAHLPNFAELAALTTYGNRTEYCRRHGYDLKVMTSGFEMPAAHPVSWDRWSFMCDVLGSGEYDWVYCCGTDTLHTNLTVPLERFADPAFHVVAAPDWCAPIQADSVLIRSSLEGLHYAKQILALYPAYRDDPWVENQAMIRTLHIYGSIIKLLPQYALNAYDYRLFSSKYPDSEKVRAGRDYYGQDGQWHPGDFLIHWPSLPLATRIEQVKKLTPFIVR